MVSFEQVTLASSVNAHYRTGTVLGRITGTGRFVQVNPTAADGSQYACAVLFADTFVSAGVEQNATVVNRKALVIDRGLIFPDGTTGSQFAIALGQLEGQGIQSITRASA